MDEAKIEKVVEPENCVIKVGRLEIYNLTAEPDKARTGIGTRIYVDGKELGGVVSIDLRIRPDEPIRATIVLLN